MPLELTHDSRVCCENHIPGDLFLLSEAADHYIFNFNGISKHKLEIPGQIFLRASVVWRPETREMTDFFKVPHSFLYKKSRMNVNFIRQ